MWTWVWRGVLAAIGIYLILHEAISEEDHVRALILGIAILLLAGPNAVKKAAERFAGRFNGNGEKK